MHSSQLLALLAGFAVIGMTLQGCGGSDASLTRTLTEPIAKVKPKTLTEHGHERVDNYYWLNEREDLEVLSYLEAENDYTKAVMAHTESFQEELFEEIKGRIKKDDSSVPYLKKGYYYYSRYEEGGEYAIYCRKEGSLEADEQVILNGNELAEGEDFFSLRGLSVSSERNILAFSTDTVGRRIFTIRFRDLDSGEYLKDEIPEVTGNLAWANDNKTLFYAKQDPQTLRSHQIWRHELGSDPSEDVLVYQEDDEEFSSYVWKTKSEKYLMIGSRQTLSSEARFLAADDPTGEFKLLLPREEKHEYSADHFGGDFYIYTNWEAKNFRLMKTPVGKTAKSNWKEVIPHRDDVLLENFEIFEDYLVVAEREGGLVRMQVRPWKGEAHYYDVVVDGKTNKDAAWYYPETLPAAKNIRNHVAFWRGVHVVGDSPETDGLGQ